MSSEGLVLQRFSITRTALSSWYQTIRTTALSSHYIKPLLRRHSTLNWKIGASYPVISMTRITKLIVGDPKPKTLFASDSQSQSFCVHLHVMKKLKLDKLNLCLNQERFLTSLHLYAGLTTSHLKMTSIRYLKD